MAARFLILFALFVAMHVASATDPNQLDDFCVSPKTPSTAVLVQGQLCKKPSEVTVDDFVLRGIPDNKFIDASNLPGLNTLGISLYKLNMSAGSVAPPHYHPRGTEVFTVLQGSFKMGFVSFDIPTITARHFDAQTLNAGDVFVIPQGTLHYAQNVGKSDAIAFVAFSSQYPGVVPAPTALFKTVPRIPVDILSKAFKLDPEIVKGLQG